MRWIVPPHDSHWDSNAARSPKALPPRMVSPIISAPPSRTPYDWAFLEFF